MWIHIIHEGHAVYTLTANPIRVKASLDYLVTIYVNEKTMHGERVLGFHDSEHWCFSYSCVVMKQNHPPLSFICVTSIVRQSLSLVSLLIVNSNGCTL